MFVIVGLVIVFGAIIGGFMMEGGHLSLLLQPAELVIIGGAAIGAFIASCTGLGLKLSLGGFGKAVTGKTPQKKDYLEMLSSLYALFSKIHREGIISIEKDIENPESSQIFQRYPSVGKNVVACQFVGDSFRTFMTSNDAGEVEKLMGIDMHAMKEEEDMPSHKIQNMADSMPGMGIVAAVLGVVLAMGKINEPPEVLGHTVAAALVGTFLGILLCYGIVGPFGGKLASIAEENEMFMNCIRQAVAASMRGLPPIVAVEFGRRAIPHTLRPSFNDLEQALRS